MLETTPRNDIIFNRRRRILKIVAGTQIAVASITTVYDSFTLFTTNSNATNQSLATSIFSTLISVLTLIVGISVYLLARKDNPRYFQIGAYIATGLWTVGIFVSGLVTVYNPLIVAAFFLPMMSAGLLFSPKEILGWLVGLEIFAGLVYVLDIINNNTGSNSQSLYVDFIFFFLLLLIVGGGLWYLQVNVRNVVLEINARAEKLAELNLEREKSRHAGEELGFRLNSMAAELGVVAVQQSSHTTQQALAVTEVTAGLSELGDIARQIANSSEQVRQSAGEGLARAKQLQGTSLRVSTTADKGQAAVESSMQSIQEVREGIADLSERLRQLSNSSTHINTIITIIKEIADQTHLLALNAAIESAGAGENGHRFAAVASEVKQLADRSLRSVKEVSNVIGTLQTDVLEALKASERANQKTFGAVDRGNQAAQAIVELGGVIEEAAVNSTQIVEAVQQIVIQAEEITISTRQQETAAQTIVEVMEEVEQVTSETANATEQVRVTVNTIKEISAELKAVLSANLETLTSRGGNSTAVATAKPDLVST